MKNPERGNVGNIDILKTLFLRYPRAVFHVMVTHCIDPTRVRVFGLDIENAAEEDGRAYVCRADITTVLPAAFLKQLKMKMQELESDRIFWPDFRKLGKDMARTMNRRVILTLMYGSTVQEEAMFRSFTFKP